MRRLRRDKGGERSWSWAAVSLSMTTMGPPQLGQSQSGLVSLAVDAVWLGLRLHHCEGLPAKWQESGPAPVGEKAEMANADEAFGEQVQQEAAQELIER